MRFFKIPAVWMLAMTMSSAATPAQETVITVEQLPCIPVAEHAIVKAKVDNDVPGTRVRLYFRRLHQEVEDFYYVVMEPAGGGNYWTALPKPADEPLAHLRLEARRSERDEERDHPEGAWWRRKEASEDRDPNDDLDEDVIRERASVGKRETRHWMEEMDLATLQRWLAEQVLEPAEYYAAVIEPGGRVLAKSSTRVVEVREERDCEVMMTPQEEGFSKNLVIGETALWQKRGERVFHWLCDHVVTRIDLAGILRSDEICRACVIAWWNRKELMVPVGLAGVGGILIDRGDEPSPSPSRP